MEHDLLEGAACAASDLTARLHAELARADANLAVADARVLAVLASGAKVPQQLLGERRNCREQVASLLQILSGMPMVEGGRRAASA